MGILVCVVSGFAAAAAAPLLARFSDRIAGWVLALVPAALFAYLLSTVGESRRISYAWVDFVDVALAFNLDGLSLFFALLVSGVAACVLIYSSTYIRGAPYAGRFYGYMMLFMAAMLGLVFADNLITLYVFFELTSITSFLLIGLDGGSRTARRASRQALIITTAGGLALLAGVLLMGEAAGSYVISDLVTQGDLLRASPYYAAIVLLIAFGAFTKSAQIPFHVWLPNAMVAPTPVSAYLHAAAMVKAGIYVLARFSPALSGTQLWMMLLTAAGGLTMVAAAWLAFREADLKRVLAYATIAALGLMVMLLGVGTTTAVEACLTYVLVHACYKAALFMTAGALQHHTDTRDVREMSGLRKPMPMTFGVAALAGLSMAGAHPFLGALGKDLALEAVLSNSVLLGGLIAASVGLVAAAALVALGPFTGPSDEPRAEGLSVWWIAPGILATAGLAFGLAPDLIDASILSPAVSRTLAKPTELELHLWKGFTPPFLIGIASIAVGFAVYLLRNPIRRELRILSAALDAAPDRAYDAALSAFGRIAAAITGWMQNGSLRRYLSLVFVSSAGLVGTALAFGMDAPLVFDVRDVRLHEWLIVGAMLAAGAAALRVRSRLGVILLLSTVSYGIALIYLLFGAPDLALTQLLVETLLAILVVLAFVDLPRLRPISTRRHVIVDGAIAVGGGAIVTFLMLTVVATPFNTSVVGFYETNAYILAHGRNVVNVILVDFRALDTMGETIVLAVAGLSIYVLLRNGRDKPKAEPPEELEASS